MCVRIVRISYFDKVEQSIASLGNFLQQLNSRGVKGLAKYYKLLLKVFSKGDFNALILQSIA